MDWVHTWLHFEAVPSLDLQLLSSNLQYWNSLTCMNIRFFETHLFLVRRPFFFISSYGIIFCKLNPVCYYNCFSSACGWIDDGPKLRRSFFTTVCLLPSTHLGWCFLLGLICSTPSFAWPHCLPHVSNPWQLQWHLFTYLGTHGIDISVLVTN